MMELTTYSWESKLWARNVSGYCAEYEQSKVKKIAYSIMIIMKMQIDSSKFDVVVYLVVSNHVNGTKEVCLSA